MSANFVSERNLKFLLYDMFDTLSLTRHAHYGEHGRQTFDMILDATIKLAKDLCLPTLEEMDEHPPVLEDGKVKVHPQVRRFMHECGEGGWIGAGFPCDLEGEQLWNRTPHALSDLYPSLPRGL